MHRNGGRSVRASQEAEIQESRPEQRWKIRAGIAADAGPGSGKRGAVSGRVGGVGTASRQSRERSGAAPGPPERQNIFFAPARGLSPLVRPLLLEAILKLLGSRLGALWGLFWAPWGLLGAFLGRQGASWAVLGPSWAILGAYRAVLGPSWAVLGPSWASLGVLLGRLGRLLGRPGPVWSHLWALLGDVLGDLGGLWGRFGRVEEQ